MKKILAVVFALIAIGHADAKGTEPRSPVGMSVVKNGSVIRVFYQGEQTGKVKVLIYNEKGQRVFSEVMKNTENFMRPYNFSSLPDGEYTIEISDEKGKHFKRIAYFREPEERIAYLARLKKGEAKYMLAVLNDGREALTIRIYDERHHLLYKETQVPEGNFAKVYNLNQVAGQHIFEVADQTGNITRLSKSGN